MVEAQNPDFSRGLGVLSARAPHFRPGFAASVNGSVAKARWLALGVVLLLGVSTAVAAVRNSDDDNGNGHDEAPAAAPAPAEEAPVQDQAEGQQDLDQDPATETPPAVEATPPGAETAPATPSPATRRVGDRSVSRGAPSNAAAPAPAAAASPAPQPAPAPEGEAGFERSGAPPAPPGGSGESSPPPPDAESDEPEATPKPAPGALVDVTAAIRFEPVRFVVVVASNPEPEADVTVGNDKVVGDEPPPERTEVGIGGELFPPSAQAVPAWQGPTAA
jgi:hypothetical protein